jgi:hypothetical protein
MWILKRIGNVDEAAKVAKRRGLLIGLRREHKRKRDALTVKVRALYMLGTKGTNTLKVMELRVNGGAQWSTGERYRSPWLIGLRLEGVCRRETACLLVV